jgi:hydrogenase/urease accessory protein HupE
LLEGALMDSSIFCFATDLGDEGIETVLDNVEHRGGLGGVTVAAAYHEGRDVFPHNPVRRVRFLESGAVFFPPGSALRATRLQPPVSEAAHVLPEAIAAANRRGLAVRAWTVFLHNGALAATHPECAPENAFGDRYVTELCPANPDARAYARALAADIAALGVAGICSEALHYLGLEHGYAHERYFVPLGARVRYLLGLCFCEHCLAAARAAGVDGEAVRRDAREAIEQAFAGDDPGREPEHDEYARVREQVVTSLVGEVAEAAGETPFEFIELSGAVKGYADGLPTGDPSPTIAWQLGVQVEEVAAACGGIEAMGYAADPAWVARDLDTYGDAAVSVIFRPSTPDCGSADDLRTKIDLARDRGLRRVDFYHYGLMRLDALDWIHTALRG